MDPVEDSTFQPSRDEKEPIEPPVEVAVVDKKLLRKMDWYILPPITILYLLCYLDRTYITMTFQANLETSEAPGRREVSSIDI